MWKQREALRAPEYEVIASSLRRQNPRSVPGKAFSPTYSISTFVESR